MKAERLTSLWGMSVTRVTSNENAILDGETGRYTLPD